MDLPVHLEQLALPALVDHPVLQVMQVIAVNHQHLVQQEALVQQEHQD